MGTVAHKTMSRARMNCETSANRESIDGRLPVTAATTNRIVAAIHDEPREIIANSTTANTSRVNVMKFGTFNERRSMRGNGGADDVAFAVSTVGSVTGMHYSSDAMTPSKS